MDERYKLIQGDCLEVLKSLEDGSVDAVITDPPYGITLPGSSSSGPGGSRNFDFFAEDDPDLAITALREAGRVLHAESSVFVFCGHRQFGPLVVEIERQRMTTKPFAWVKKCPVPAATSMRWTSGFEMAVYGFTAGSHFRRDGAGLRPNVMQCDSYRHGQPGKVDHPTQKPLSLLLEIVSRMARPGMTILDPFMGSGTTGVAALQMGCKFIGIEIEPKYFEIAKRRIEAEARQRTLDFGGQA